MTHPTAIPKNRPAANAPFFDNDDSDDNDIINIKLVATIKTPNPQRWKS